MCAPLTAVMSSGNFRWPTPRGPACHQALALPLRVSKCFACDPASLHVTRKTLHNADESLHNIWDFAIATVRWLCDRNNTRADLHRGDSVSTRVHWWRAVRIQDTGYKTSIDSWQRSGTCDSGHRARRW